MIQEFVKSCLLVFVAEMGDKSQILAMTFATKYPIRKVLLGVLLGACLNHGIAVALGSYLSRVLSLEWLKIAASLIFLGFGLWTLIARDEEEEEGKGLSHTFGPVLTVTSAYFLSELGDKTQITAIGLAAGARAPVLVLIGTVSGMVLTGSVGILIGSRLGHRIPELGIKLASSGVFTLFGLVSLSEAISEAWLSRPMAAASVVGFGVVYGLLVRSAIKRSREQRLGRLAIASGRLFEHLHRTRNAVEDLCLGEEYCGRCQQVGCPVGFAKKVLDVSLDHHNRLLDSVPELPPAAKKGFDTEIAAAALSEVLASCERCGGEHQELCAVSQTRCALELVYFGEVLPFSGDLAAYLEVLGEKDRELSEKVSMQLSA